MSGDGSRRRWGIWLLFVAALALLLAAPLFVPPRAHPWHPAQTAVAGFVVALLSLPLGVSTFALRERLREASGVAANVELLLFSLWGRCLLIGLFGCVLAYGAATPRAAWPFVAATALLLLLHAPRRWLLESREVEE